MGHDASPYGPLGSLFVHELYNLRLHYSMFTLHSSTIAGSIFFCFSELSLSGEDCIFILDASGGKHRFEKYVVMPFIFLVGVSVTSEAFSVEVFVTSNEFSIGVLVTSEACTA